MYESKNDFRSYLDVGLTLKHYRTPGAKDKAPRRRRRARSWEDSPGRQAKSNNAEHRRDTIIPRYRDGYQTRSGADLNNPEIQRKRAHERYRHTKHNNGYPVFPGDPIMEERQNYRSQQNERYAREGRIRYDQEAQRKKAKARYESRSHNNGYGANVESPIALRRMSDRKRAEKEREYREGRNRKSAPMNERYYREGRNR